MDEGDAQTPTRDTGLDLSDYPLVNALRSALTEDHSAAEFEAGLEALLDRLDLHLSQ